MNAADTSTAAPVPVATSGLDRLRSFRWTASRVTVLAAVLTLVVPVVLFGPWLPMLDLVAFVGMYSYPPQQSYGPLHQYVFQFSYVGVLAISRMLSDLQLPVRFHIPFYYLLQCGVCLAVVYGTLSRLIAHRWVRSIGIALGTVALWDGVFIWGGPLGYSLGTCALSWATFLMFREAAEPKGRSRVLIPLLVLFSLCCHPFLLAFVFLLCAVRFVHDRATRWHTVGVAAGAALFTYIIVRDSPGSEVGTATGGLRMMFGFDLTEIGHRLAWFFRRDTMFVQILFGRVPLSASVALAVLAGIRALGFIASPFFALQRRHARWIRMLATLDACVGLLYLFSWDSPQSPMGDWPQRILTAFSPVTYLTGFIAGYYLLRRVQPRFADDRPVRAVAWVVPALLLVAAGLFQSQLFAFARPLEASIDRARATIVQSGVSDAYVVAAGIDHVTPFYLRCVPFVLFSDQEIISHNVLIGTEWHVQPRHPSRITEDAVDMGRKRYNAFFATSDGEMAVRLQEQPESRFPVTEATNQRTWLSNDYMIVRQFNQGGVLLRAGAYQSALEHFNTVIYLRPDFARAWNDGGAALVKLNSLEDAVRYFRKAVECDPTLAAARANLGLGLIETGHSDEAVPQLKEALRIEPDNAQAKDLLKRLSESSSAPSPRSPGKPARVGR
jgi:tetratricopeptide (TPR) repeat protein